MYCLRLFVIVLQELHCLLHVYCYYCGVFIENYVCTKVHHNWVLFELHGHLCPYHNVWPEAVCCCFTSLPNCLHVCMIRVKGCYHITKFRCSIPYGF